MLPELSCAMHSKATYQGNTLYWHIYLIDTLYPTKVYSTYKKAAKVSEKSDLGRCLVFTVERSDQIISQEHRGKVMIIVGSNLASCLPQWPVQCTSNYRVDSYTELHHVIKWVHMWVCMWRCVIERFNTFFCEGKERWTGHFGNNTHHIWSLTV